MMFEALGELAEKVPDGMNIFDQLPEDKLIRRNFVMFVLWFYLQQEKERVHNWGEYKEGSSHVEKVFSNVACANTAFIRYICLSSRKFSDEEIHFIDDFDFSKAQK